MVANTPGKHFRLNNPAHLTGLIVGGRPSDRLEFITRENCLRVISSQFRANQPGCVIFPSRHLEAGSADEDRNLRPMHVRGVGRQDRASQTILLIKVSWINSLARACLTTSKRNVGFSR
jgi:hypothetical protein